MSKPTPPKYKTTHWKAYNAALKARGSLMIWLDRDMHWLGSPLGKRGRTQTFSDAAIQFCLTIKCLFNLALRQAASRSGDFHPAERQAVEGKPSGGACPERDSASNAPSESGDLEKMEWLPST